MPDLPDEVRMRVDGGEGAGLLKRALRETVLRRRRALTTAERYVADQRVLAALLNLVSHTAPTRVTGYVPVGSEPGGGQLPAALAAALSPAGQLLLPVLRDDLDLDWAAYPGEDGLVAVGRGLREPIGPRLGTEAVTTAGLVVVPALAVDRTGNRLGRGGGSYDRALRRLGPQTLVVALLHDGELVEEVPGEPHDQPVHAVITPALGLVRLPTAAVSASTRRVDESR